MKGFLRLIFFGLLLTLFSCAPPEEEDSVDEIVEEMNKVMESDRDKPFNHLHEASNIHLNIQIKNENYNFATELTLIGTELTLNYKRDLEANKEDKRIKDISVDFMDKTSKLLSFFKLDEAYENKYNDISEQNSISMEMILGDARIIHVNGGLLAYTDPYMQKAQDFVSIMELVFKSEEEFVNQCTLLSIHHY